MKSITSIVLFLILLGKVSGQFTDVIAESSKKTADPIINSDDYIPDDNTPMKYIRVNIHIMLLEDSHASAPNNFTKTDDGRGDSNYTGYDWAEDLIKVANQRQAGNPGMRYLIGNTTDSIARKYRFALNGIFFHKDNYYYDFDHSPQAVYGENIGEAINVYYQSDHVGAIDSHGSANMTGDRVARFANKWGKYNDYYLTEGKNIGNWGNAVGLMHETGHNLSLHHTVLDGGGDCCDSCDDNCTDTPTRVEVLAIDGVDPCQPTQWNNPLNSNNVMDYGGGTAITPQQLGVVHWTIDNELDDYRASYFISTSKNITNFTDNSAIIGQTVTIPSSNSITVDDNSALYISCETFIINGSLEIEQGSQLVINSYLDQN